MNPETQLPDECFPYMTQDSNRLVEEFMLLANMAVAKKIFDTFPSHALLRRHPPPKEQKLAEVGLLSLTLMHVVAIIAK